MIKRKMIKLLAEVGYNVPFFRELVDDLLQETKIQTTHRAVIDIQCKTQKAAIYDCRTESTSIQYPMGRLGAFLIEGIRHLVPFSIKPFERPLRDDFASIVRFPVISNGPSQIVHVGKVGAFYICEFINRRE